MRVLALACLALVAACARGTDDLIVQLDATPGLDATFTDASTDRDASLADEGVHDAGPPARCDLASECTNLPVPDPDLCRVFGSEGAPACLDGQCLSECGGGRTCTTDVPGMCTSCGGQVSCASSCPLDGFMPRAARIERTSSGCPANVPGTTTELSTAVFSLFPTQRPCSYALVLANDVGQLGVFRSVGESEWVGDFPGLGHCSAFTAPTNAYRLVFSCPGCVFTMGF